MPMKRANSEKRSARDRKVTARRAAERKADPKLVAKTVALIAEAESDKRKAALSIGAHLFGEYFGKQIELVRSRSPVKDKSYSALEKRSPKLGWTDRDLRDAVSAHVVTLSLDRRIERDLPFGDLV